MSIDKENFLADRRVSSLLLDPPDMYHMVNRYDSTLRDVVDKHAHLRKKGMPRTQPLLP